MSTKKLRPHHDAWLRAHPDRTEVWLRQMFIEGFDVHHVDGDHDNNTPLNLVLIEAVDHMRLHGMNLKDGIPGWRRKLQEKSTKAKAARKAAKANQSQVEPLDHKPYEGAPLTSELDELSVRAYQSRLNARPLLAAA